MYDFICTESIPPSLCRIWVYVKMFVIHPFQSSQFSLPALSVMIGPSDYLSYLILGTNLVNTCLAWTSMLLYFSVSLVQRFAKIKYTSSVALSATVVDVRPCSTRALATCMPSSELYLYWSVFHALFSATILSDHSLETTVGSVSGGFHLCDGILRCAICGCFSFAWASKSSSG